MKNALASPAPASWQRAGRIIAVASGKGGVGKTWFAITAAHALARQGRRVLLFDADLGLANVDIQLGLTPDRDIGAVISGKSSLDQVALPHPAGGFDVIAGRSGSGLFSALDAPTLGHVLASVRAVATRYDVVLLDLGAGLDRTVRTLAAFADCLLVVAIDEPTSLTDAYAVLKLHMADQSRGEARVIVNQASTQAGGQRTYATLSRACKTFLGFTPPLAGIIRRDDRVRDAIRHQTLLSVRHPSANAAADVEAIASTLGLHAC